jgi:hypothetical protein
MTKLFVKAKNSFGNNLIIRVPEVFSEKNYILSMKIAVFVFKILFIQVVHGYIPFWLNRQLKIPILDIFDEVSDGLIVVFRGQLIQHTLTESFRCLDELLYTVESHIAFDYIPDLLPLLDCLYRQVVSTLFSFVVEVIQPALAVEQIDFVEVIWFSLNRDFFDGFCLVVHGFVSFLIVALDYIIQSRLARRIFSTRNKLPCVRDPLAGSVADIVEDDSIDYRKGMTATATIESPLRMLLNKFTNRSGLESSDSVAMPIDYFGKADVAFLGLIQERLAVEPPPSLPSCILADFMSHAVFDAGRQSQGTNGAITIFFQSCFAQPTIGFDLRNAILVSDWITFSVDLDSGLFICHGGTVHHSNPLGKHYLIFFYPPKIILFCC